MIYRLQMCVCVLHSGFDSGRFNTGSQMAVSPTGYIGYSRTESFSSVGGAFQFSFVICS